MGDDDEFDDEPPTTHDTELNIFEKRLFAAIRESHKLDAEIDDEYRLLTNGECHEPATPETGAPHGDEP